MRTAAMNVLISSAGRRVGLLECFRQSLSDLSIPGRIVAIDATPYSPAGRRADAYHIVPKCTEPDFLAEVLEVCQQQDVNLIVPTIDTELPIYAEASQELSRLGICVAVSSPETISICFDKIRTHNWLVSHGFPVPRQSTPKAVLSNPDSWEFPLIVKPRDGSASVGVRVISSFEELEAGSLFNNGLIVQELICGTEFTINVFVDKNSRCLCAVPHVRMEVRAGEVSKGMTVRDSALISLVQRLVETLPGAYGPLNVQCFVNPKGDIRIIEINGRFGGGYPLSHRAGAHMTKWLIEESMGLIPVGPFDEWEDGLVMLRYDNAVFLHKNDISADNYVQSMRHIRSG
jgi:carbamoyl-phosphate synthase large subunit